MSMPIIFPDFAAGTTLPNRTLSWLQHQDAPYKSAVPSTTPQDQRQSLNIEGYKFLFDYHGFVPYLGAGIDAKI